MECETSNSFVEFRSPTRMLRTKISKFNADKVLKTEHDALPEDHTFYLLGTRMRNVYIKIYVLCENFLEVLA